MNPCIRYVDSKNLCACVLTQSTCLKKTIADVRDVLVASNTDGSSPTRLVCRELILNISIAGFLAGLQCSVDNLPPFGTMDFRDAPEDDRFQAIVPGYTFQCSGRVTEWKACVQPGGSSRCQFYIQFQVWRPTAISGCYSLVNFSSPVDGNGNDGVLSPPGDDRDPLHRCVVLSVPEDQQIEVQSGDVVGYYVDHFRDGADRDDGGIQWIEDDNSDVVVHYRQETFDDELPREDIKSHYAVGGVNPTSCGFPISDGSISSYSLTTSISAYPIISLTGMCMKINICKIELLLSLKTLVSHCSTNTHNLSHHISHHW